MNFKIPEEEHCDSAITRMDWPDELRWWILLNRLPAGYKMLARKMLGENWPVIYAKHEGRWCKLWTASRFGDITISYDLEAQSYGARVLVSELTELTTEKP